MKGSRMTETTEHNAAPEGLVSLVGEQIGLYQRLEELSLRQHELVESEDTDALLGVLTERQRLIEDITNVASRMTPYRARWDDHVGRLAEGEREAKGWKVLGMRPVTEQHWADFPDKTEPRFGTVPKASGSNKWARMEVLQRCARFQEAYAEARDAYVAGDREVEFPCGTWLMRRRFNVRCTASPP